MARSTVRAVLKTGGIMAGLDPLTDDAERPMAPLEARLPDVRRAGLRHSKPVRREQHGQGGMRPVVALAARRKAASSPGSGHPPLWGNCHTSSL